MRFIAKLKDEYFKEVTTYKIPYVVITFLFFNLGMHHFYTNKKKVGLTYLFTFSIFPGISTFLSFFLFFGLTHHGLSSVFKTILGIFLFISISTTFIIGIFSIWLFFLDLYFVLFKSTNNEDGSITIHSKVKK